MTEITPAELDKLRELQRIELQIGRIQTRIEHLTTAKRDLNERVTVCEAAVRGQSERIDEQRKAYRLQEGEVRRLEDKIRKSEAKLPSVKSNKEYQALLKEVDEVRSQVSGIEDEMLERLEGIETEEAQLAARERDLAVARQAVASEAADFETEIAGGQARLVELNEAREELETQAGEKWMTVYRRARKWQADQVAVCQAVASNCRGCHMNIPAQLYNELQAGNQLIHCPHCERILYWRADDDEGI